ncbi:MAG: glutathione-disulfide reductase [Gammaproteobacteria bacterium]|nr:glutathione-disulfide reductase [Gammaproteobacteria bacterium]
MAQYDFDLFVIGVGSGGVRAARMAANYGARVASAEDRYMGGTCVNVGCVPKKLFVIASHYSEDYHHARGYGWGEAEPAFDWDMLRENKDREIGRLNGIYRGLLDGAGVTHFDGRARIAGPHAVTVNGETLTTEKILVATGGWPVMPDVPGIEHAISSNEAFFLPELPKRALVVGGGYIAVEFAGIFNGLGVDAHLAYRGPLFLRGFDGDVREFVADELRKKGISLHFDTSIVGIERAESGVLTARLADGGEIETDLILYATGRAPAVHDIGLENVDVRQRENGAIIVDDYFQTSEPSVFALGDVTDRVQLTPVAIAEAMAFASTWFRDQRVQMDYDDIATAVFCQPNIGTVGLTEEEARDEFGRVDVYRSTFTPLKHTLTGSDEKTLMKLIVEPTSDKVVGIHMVGPEAGEIVQGMAVAVKAGATKAQFDATVAIHPTSAEEFVTMREPVG